MNNSNDIKLNTNNNNNINSNKVFESSSKNVKNYHSSNGFEFYTNNSSKQNRMENSHVAGLYDFEGTIGQGHFAVVKLARHIFSGEKVAIKVIDKNKLDEISREHLFQEVRCMKLVQHPNVVRLYEVIDTSTKLYLILELGDGGDMYDYIMKHSNGLSEQKSKNYFRQIVRAIKYCHDLHVVHRDLKPENVVFFEQTGQVKLTDFGFSNIFVPGTKLFTSCGSLAYSAPEILLGDSYDAPAVDVWSLGVILYMLATGRAPFQEANDSETLTMILDCKYILPAHVSLECNDLISRMLVRDPEKRIKLDEITSHVWLQQNSDEDDENNNNNNDNEDEDELSASSGDTYNNENMNNNNNINGGGGGEDEDDYADVDDDDEVDSQVASVSKRRLNKENNNYPVKRKRNFRDKYFKKYIPLIKRENISEQDNNEIIESMLNGQIATKEEILKALDEDKYNYITATYYLLAEKLLKKHYQKRSKRKVTTTNFKPIVIPFNDSVANNNNNNDSAYQFKSIAKNSLVNQKSNYTSNNKSVRSKLVRQDEANEQEIEGNEQIIVKTTKSTTTTNDDAKQQQTEEIILVAQTPLTNILEDEEEPFDEEINFKPDLSNLIHNTTNTNNTPLMTNSRRSSRGGENTITALTILEENESDQVSVNNNSFNNNVNSTIRVSNSKLKLYPYSLNKQTTSDESLSKLIYDEDVNELTRSNDRLNGSEASFSATAAATTKNRIKLFTTKLLSSGADTSSDTSDTELRSITNTNNNKEMKDFDWNRSASSSSRSRSKSSRHTSNQNQNLLVLNEQQQQQRIRPVSISSDTNNKDEMMNGNGSLLKQEYQNGFYLRTKSLAEEGNNPVHLNTTVNNVSNHQHHNHHQNSNNKGYLSVSSSNSNDHLSANLNSIGKSLSVEHRIANMSQMSINSQLSKNNSLRFPNNNNNNNRSGACDTPNQHYQQSTTPTPRESIVFNRGDEKPITKILLSQHHQLKSQNSTDFSVINHHHSLSSGSSSPRMSLRSQIKVNPKITEPDEEEEKQQHQEKKSATNDDEFNNVIDSKLKPTVNNNNNETTIILVNEQTNNNLNLENKSNISKSLKSLDSTISLSSTNNQKTAAKNSNSKKNSENISIQTSNIDDTTTTSTTIAANKTTTTNLPDNLKSLTLESKHTTNDKEHILGNKSSDNSFKNRKQKKKKNSSQIIQKSEIDLFEKKTKEDSVNTKNKLYSNKTCTKCCTII